MVTSSSAGGDPGPDALDSFSAPVRGWFSANFGAATAAQDLAWPAIRAGEHVLLSAPTGSGKTLAAFLSAIDRLGTEAAGAERAPGPRVVYVSPLRALAVDIDKNLRAPLRGIELAAERLGEPWCPISVGVRTGDTSTAERRQLVRRPPDILITTPESLYLMLTSAARETLRGVETVIVDEIHAVAATKRGSHLAVTLERLVEICHRPPQRIGLSATQRPLEEIAFFLGGQERDPANGSWRRRPVTVVEAPMAKTLDLQVLVPLEDMSNLGEYVEDPAEGSVAAGPQRRSIWPAMHPALLELVLEHRSTILFVNNRRLAERLAARLNELYESRRSGSDDGRPEFSGGENQGVSSAEGEELVKAHHGSLSRHQRLVIEDQLKRGELRGLVATSSLELGIDMGAVDLVVLVESPGSVARGLQRVGRAGHQVGAPSRGRLFPKHRGDLIETAAVVQRMDAGLIEHTRFVRNPLDVAAQQIVAACALDEWHKDGLADLLRRSAPFAELSDDLLGGILDLLDGRYPSEEFAELKPRITWDRGTDTIRGRAGAQRLAVTNAGTIPDRGLFGVFLPDGTRVGELDEEMVYESRVGETFLLGASTWRIQDITHERVVVVPAPGQPGKMPFWRGEGPGRPVELGKAMGAMVRELRTMPRPKALERLVSAHHLDEWAAANLMGYLDEQAEATGVVADDRTIVVEKFRDEIGDWRVCIHTPFGARVNAPWAIALRYRLNELLGDEIELMWSDDGIILRLPESVDDISTDDLALDPDDARELVVSALSSTAMFASRFRESAARALLLPRRRVDQRTPLWQQRQRAAGLLAVAAKYPSFPILLETTREILNDHFDLPSLIELQRDIRSRNVRVVTVETPSPSPFAKSLLYSWIAVYMYEGDAPLAERRAAALALDPDLLRDLLGTEELRSLLDADVLDDVEAELQRLTPERHARDADEVRDLLRVLGPLDRAEVRARSIAELDVDDALDELVRSTLAIEVTVAGVRRWADAADAARLRDALGVAIPLGLPTAFTDPVDCPMRDLIERFARTHGPFSTEDPASRLGIGVSVVAGALAELVRAGRVTDGAFRSDRIGQEWCHLDVLRVLRRRSLAVLRAEIEPVDHRSYARFLLGWHGIGGPRHGREALVDAIAQLQGAPLVASTLERDLLGVRLAGFQPPELDALCTSGDLVWVGAGSIGSTDGRVQLLFRSEAHLFIRARPDAAVGPAGTDGDPTGPAGPLHDALRAHLAAHGASFWAELMTAVLGSGAHGTDAEVLEALWDLVWAGEVTNDSLAPLRARVSGGRIRAADRSRRPRPGRLSRLGPPAGAGRWSAVSALARHAASPTEIAAARANALLDRYGVLTRQAALGEGVEAGFAGVYPVLQAMEDRGQLRRGYFIGGLGAAQFARPGAVDRLRAVSGPAADDEPAPVVVLAATDPAQPYGASLPWPASAGRPARAAGTYVVIDDGEPVAYLERGGRSILTFPTDRATVSWVDALAGLVRSGRVASLEIGRIDGEPATGSTWEDQLVSAGFRPGYRGLVLRSR